MVANQVLLSTMWYVTSCWIFSSSYISQFQRLIRNLWFGKNGDATRAKVAWPIITLPTSHGGLGIVDRACQSSELIGKFVVRSLVPGAEPRKEFLLHRLHRCAPATRGPWQPDIRWIFVEMR